MPGAITIEQTSSWDEDIDDGIEMQISPNGYTSPNTTSFCPSGGDEDGIYDDVDLESPPDLVDPRGEPEYSLLEATAVRTVGLIYLDEKGTPTPTVTAHRLVENEVGDSFTYSIHDTSNLNSSHFLDPVTVLTKLLNQPSSGLIRGKRVSERLIIEVTVGPSKAVFLSLDLSEKTTKFLAYNELLSPAWIKDDITKRLALSWELHAVVNNDETSVKSFSNHVNGLISDVDNMFEGMEGVFSIKSKHLYGDTDYSYSGQSISLKHDKNLNGDYEVTFNGPKGNSQRLQALSFAVAAFEHERILKKDVNQKKDGLKQNADSIKVCSGVFLIFLILAVAFLLATLIAPVPYFEN